jgi:hypothetical protein
MAFMITNSIVRALCVLQRFKINMSCIMHETLDKYGGLFYHESCCTTNRLVIGAVVFRFVTCDGGYPTALGSARRVFELIFCVDA